MSNNEELMMFMRHAQFEKCKGELRAFIMLFNFMPTYSHNGNYDTDSKNKLEIMEKAENMIEEFIKDMEGEFF